MLVTVAIGAFVLLAVTTLVFASIRLLFILQPLRGQPPPRRPGSASHLLVVLGSGGHTAEMLAMLRNMDTKKYTHRTYVVSEGDSISAQRARAFEEDLTTDKSVKRTNDTLSNQHHVCGSYTIWTVPRARKIHQSLLTTPLSCLRTFLAILALLSGRSTTTTKLPSSVPLAPDLVLANGPATSAIVIFAQLLLRFLDFGGSTGHERTRIVFVESLARVRSLSLSAKCVSWCVDRLVVQWEELKGQGSGRAEYAGLVVVDGVERMRR